MSEILNQLQEGVEYLSERIPFTPEIGLILGSGLGVLGEEVENAIIIPYSAIPGFSESKVAGHAGQLVAGEISGKKVLLMQGRIHYYEGHSMESIVYPVRVMKMLGIDNLLITNAAGGVNEKYIPGDLMIISDHIKLSLDSPLRGKNIDEFGSRFPDMSNAYNKDLIQLAKVVAEEIDLSVKTGVYMFMGGPNYETPAEVKMIRTLGADAVGMSTVPETICAVHAGMRVMGISCITNLAAGILDKPLDHNEVMDIAEQVKERFIQFVSKIILRWKY